MMDAVIYIRDMQRMCKSHISCNGCELKPGNGKSCMEGMDPQKCIFVVEQWAAEHPAKTRQSVFLKQFPNAPIYTNTHNVALDPCLIDTTLRGHCPTGRGCDICRREFWLAEVEE
jgi:hypothetical protein